jgi:hypothetical protein
MLFNIFYTNYNILSIDVYIKKNELNKHSCVKQIKHFANFES